MKWDEFRKGSLAKAMYKYFGYSEAKEIESFWKKAIQTANTITITRSDKRSQVRYQKDNDGWNAIGCLNISQKISSERQLINSLMFESNCGATATIE